MRKRLTAALFLILSLTFTNYFISVNFGKDGKARAKVEEPISSENIRMLPASIYYDKALGSWMGQMIGNILGLPTEGKFIEKPNPEYVPYYSQVPSGAFTDDDTSMEWVFLHMLEEYGFEITYSQIRDEWIEHINSAIWCANARARELMDEGYVPPDTGSKENNEYWGFIDAQIECELFGVIHPGMVSEAYKMAKFFARVTNDDYAVEAAAFYAAMFSCAFFESDVSSIVKTALAKVPKTSLTWEVVSDVIRWHEEIEDWRETRERIWRKYGSYGWVSSPLNLAAVVMAILYGNGDFDYSLMIANSAGWDNDCNAATVGGLLGLIVGEKGINEKWKKPLMNIYRNTNRDNMPASEPITEIARRTQVIAEKAILKYGGSIIQQNGEKIYVIKTEIPDVKPSNSFSEDNLARKSFSTPICRDRPFTKDFLEKLNIMKDGVTKNQNLRSFNLEGDDWWGYTFGTTLKINCLVYYQGETTEECGWETLIVQYRDGMGRWINVSWLEMKPNYEESYREPFGRFILKFNTIVGTGIRLFGKLRFAGGYTSIAELEVFFREKGWEGKPTSPTNLRASLLNDGRVLLEWEDTSDNELGFKVFRREFWQGTYEEIGRVGTNIHEYIDPEIQPFRIYCYVVVAENDANSSELSNETLIFSWPPLLGDVKNSIIAVTATLIITTITILLVKTGKLKIEIVRYHRGGL
ncbi:ADP-ribosylglycohydrolase family protein [Candidatus Bathyarchaeota archaeon]|nr:ADP-ribosylglycohydrolase family protein [Candidatus Bathyarchaeota archaeon]